MDRHRKKESVVKVKVEKDYTFRDEIWEVVDTCCREGKVPNCSLPPPAPKIVRATKGKVHIRTFSIFISRTQTRDNIRIPRSPLV